MHYEQTHILRLSDEHRGESHIQKHILKSHYLIYMPRNNYKWLFVCMFPSEIIVNVVTIILVILRICNYRFKHISKQY